MAQGFIDAHEAHCFDRIALLSRCDGLQSLLINSNCHAHPLHRLRKHDICMIVDPIFYSENDSRLLLHATFCTTESSVMFVLSTHRLQKFS